jgi:hypothetical protein
VRTAGEKEQDRHGGYLPIVGAAIRHKDTGEITPGEDHLDCRVHAYRIATGDMRTAKEITKESKDDNPTPFECWVSDQPFENGFVNSIGMFFNRVNATQIVCKRAGVDTKVKELSCKDILSMPGSDLNILPDAEQRDRNRGIIDHDDKW